MADPVAAQRQFLITVSGVAGRFQTRTGAAITAETSREYDGGSLVGDVVTGPPVPADLVVGRAYRPGRDAPILAALRPKVSRWRTTITVQPADADLIAVGRPTVYTGILVGLSDPDADANSSSTARLELTFAVESVV